MQLKRELRRLHDGLWPSASRKHLKTVPGVIVAGVIVAGAVSETAFADVVVGSADTLSGPGTISDSVDNSGRIDTTSGDLTINGNLTFRSGSSLAAVLGGGTASQVHVSGNAIILDGANIILSGDLTQDTAITILGTDGVISGTFDKVVDENGNQLFYAAVSSPDNLGLVKVATVGAGDVIHQAVTGVMLDSHRGLLNTIHARIDHRYRDSTRKSGTVHLPQNAVGEIDTMALMDSRIDIYRSDLWSNDLGRHIEKNARTPEFISHLIASERSTGERLGRTLSALPRLQISSNYGGMWLEGFGVRSKQEAGANTAGYRANSGGVTIGLDSKAAKNWTFGGMIGYSLSDTDLTGNAGSADGETVYAGVYMANISTTHYANLFLTSGVSTFDADRTVTDGAATAVAEDEFGAYMWDARLELGRTFGLGTSTFIRPNVAFEYINAYQDDYADNGAGLVPGLRVEEHTTSQVRSEGQIDVLFGSTEVNQTGWSGRFYVGAAHEIYLDDMVTDAFLSGFATPIALSTGDDDHRTFSMYGVSLSWAMNQRLRAHLSYQGESNSDLQRNNVVAGFSVSW